MRVLFLVGRLPHPPWRGDQVRAFHQVRQLAGRHEITVCLIGPDPRPSDVAAVEALGAAVEIIRISGTSSLARMGLAPFDRRPVQALPYAGRRARGIVGELAADVDLVHAQTVRMGPVLPDPGPPVVVDMIDALSVNLRRRATHDRTVRGLAARWEAGRIVRYESRLARQGITVVAATTADAAALGEEVIVVPNGVDLDHFSYRAGGREGATLVFGGNLGYFPNVDAARIAVTEVLPVVRRARPDAELVLAGARPASAIRRLARREAVRLVPNPADLGAEVAAGSVAVIPMRAGTGMQNKVLEAMAVGTPVVTTPRAAEVIGAVAGEHLLIGADADAIAARVIELLEGPSAAADLAERARRFVDERYGWDAAAAALERVWLQAAG